MRGVAIFILFIFVLSLFSVLAAAETFRYNPNNRRDPFIPLVDKDGNLLPEFRPVSAEVELNLEGIVWSGDFDSYAIISGTVLKVGEMIGDYRVVKIQRDRVILNRAGEEMVINLVGQEE